MDKKYLIVNRGSASEKYAVYTKDKCLGFLHLEKSETECDYVSTLYFEERKVQNCVSKKEFQDSLNYTLNLFKTSNIIADKNEIAGIGIRIVAPGKPFQNHKVIDLAYEKEIKKVLKEAPLHLLPTYEMILTLRKAFKNIPIVGVSDSDIHSSIPDYAKYYGIAKIDSDKFGLQKYGFHGISVGSILHKLQSENAQLPSRLIVCHIGSGVSVTAIKDGKSIENSMGFTPLEGVMMATRAGDVDPGVLAFLEDNLALKGKKLREYLNKKSGLLGVSGKSSDVRDLIKLEQDGDTQSKLALDMYAYRLQKYIGSYFTILGGLDTIVFTATVGERSFIMRERICQGLEILGIKIDQEKNNRSEGIDADISASGSKVKVLVRKTDEMGQMARDTISILEK
jgi:acetate kinase